jgi:hypothetical protein
MLYLLAYTIEKETVLAINSGSFCGGEDLSETLKLLPNYKEYHSRSYTWSMSAAIHYMQFPSKIVQVESLDEVDANLLDRQIISSRSVSGGVSYVKLKDGYVPKTIKEAELI